MANSLPNLPHLSACANKQRAAQWNQTVATARQEPKHAYPLATAAIFEYDMCKYNICPPQIESVRQR
jgi:hypothetical protein